MAKAKRIKTKESIMAKYERKCRKILNKNWDKTMADLWADLDKVKEEMAVELAEIGIYKEEPKKPNIIGESIK